MIKDKRLIPKGFYCYKSLKPKYFDGNLVGFDIIDKCPYWSIKEDKTEQENGYCSYLEKGDWDFEFMGLLWDMCKECGIKEGLSLKEELKIRISILIDKIKNILKRS